MTRMDDESLQQRVDAALERLPHWKPPAGFAQRLAAAAHRQQRALAAPPPSSMRFGWLLERLGSLTLLLLAGGLVVAMLSILPWRALTAQPLQLTLLCILAMLAASAALTFRVLSVRRYAAW